MGYPKIPCPHCQLRVAATGMVAEEALVPLVTDHIASIARNFEGMCSQHGPFQHQKPTGHHSTRLRSACAEILTAEQWKAVGAQLDPSESAHVTDARGGWYVPTKAQARAWVSLAPPPTPSTARVDAFLDALPQ